MKKITKIISTIRKNNQTFLAREKFALDKIHGAEISVLLVILVAVSLFSFAMNFSSIKSTLSESATMMDSGGSGRE